MEFVDIIVSETGQTQKDKYVSNSEAIISHLESSVDVTREERYGGHEGGRRMNR